MAYCKTVPKKITICRLVTTSSNEAKFVVAVVAIDVAIVVVTAGSN